jgi:hypothetical protein
VVVVVEVGSALMDARQGKARQAAAAVNPVHLGRSN